MEDKFRISDIFKKSKEQDKAQNYGIDFSKFKPGGKKEPEKEQPPEVDFSSAVGKEQPKEPESRPVAYDSALYSEAVALARKIYNNQAEEADITGGVYSLAGRMIDLIAAGENRELLKSAIAEYLQPQHYLYYHAVNVCIFSLYIGHGLAYDSSRLSSLGVAAFLHDIGLSRYTDIISQPKKLTLQEFNQVKQHTVAGPEIISEIVRNVDINIFEVMQQEHERIDGSGYLKGLKDDDIIEDAQIVGLCDVYEAMIHQRPYRKKYSPLETIKIILGNKNTFAHKLVKLLIDKIGIFPIGTFVELNTKEVGEVLEENPDLPLRPVVNILFDGSGRRLKQSRRINLADSPTVYISETSSKPNDPLC
ncbi:MAG: HD domain-containing phosphohydrolase [Candidatus Omnitrophota bacterium]